MLLTTDRLEIVPLSVSMLTLWTDNLPELEKLLDCSYKAEPMEEWFCKILREQTEKARQDEANLLWHTFWWIIRKTDRVVVGSADFKNVPNSTGEVEIGYGLGKDFFHCGYMTETVKAMCLWSKSQPKVERVIAETEKGNLASQNVLLRCGFERIPDRENRWQY